MLNSGKKFRALSDKKNKYSNSCAIRNKKPYTPCKLNGRSLRNKKNITPPLQVKWSAPYIHV